MDLLNITIELQSMNSEIANNNLGLHEGCFYQVNLVTNTVI